MKCMGRFRIGRLVATPGALRALKRNEQSVVGFLVRHAHGDWGDVCGEDRQANEEALKTGSRLFSVYHLGDQTKVWVITEADRSATTFLLPEEY